MKDLPTKKPVHTAKETTPKELNTKRHQDEVLYPVRPRKGEEMGELYIPKLDATLSIFHGTYEDELEIGVGHFAGSAPPGENDDSVLSGHGIP